MNVDKLGEVDDGGEASIQRETEAGRYPIDLCFSDFNGDGVVDTATAYQLTNNVTVRFGENGGTFLAPSFFVTGKGPEAIVAGDVNKDGAVDLLTANHEGQDVSLLLGHGDGTFLQPVSIGFDGRGPVLDVELGDFNEDGVLDIVAGLLQDGFPRVAIRQGIGNGDFRIATYLEVPDVGPSLAIANLNPSVDAHEDIVAGGILLFGNGDGTFDNPVTYAPNLIVTAVGTGDLNADQICDIAAAGFENTTAAFLGKGDGTFDLSALYVSTPSPKQVYVTDVNRDTLTDILVTSNPASGHPSTFLENKGEEILNGVRAFPAVSNLRSRLGADDLATGDFTGDGWLDLVVVSAFAPSVLFRGGPGGLTDEWIGIPVVSGKAILTGDWNDDAKPDLIVASATLQGIELSVWLATGDGDFELKSSMALPGDRRDEITLASAPFNDDPFQDFIAATSGGSLATVFLNDGNGVLTPGPQLDIGPGVNGLLTGELNGDGRLDVVASYSGEFGVVDGGVSVALGVGDGSFLPTKPLRDNVDPESMALADVNRDQQLDLILSLEVTQFDWDVEIYHGRGDGLFTPPVALGLEDDLLADVVVADGDRDGLEDLAVSAGGNRALLFRGKGTGEFEAVFEYQVGASKLRAVDFDLDGWPDFVAPSGSGYVSVFMNPLKEVNVFLPVIRILHANGLLEVSWPDQFKNLVLTASENLEEWSIWGNAPVSSNGRYRVQINESFSKRFFRLEKD